MNYFKCFLWTLRLIVIAAVIAVMGAGFSKTSAAQEPGARQAKGAATDMDPELREPSSDHSTAPLGK